MLVFVSILTIISGELLAGDEKPSALVRARLTRMLSYRNLVSRGVDVLAVYPDGYADLAVTEEQLEWIRTQTPMSVVLERARLGAPMDIDENLGLYHTYVEMDSMLHALADSFPGISRIDTIGTSIQGNYIFAMKISDYTDIDEDETEVLIVGCHHARELMSVDVPLMLAEYLLVNYGTSPQVTDIVDEREIWIIPMLNPDGHIYVQYNHLGSSWQWWRKNRRDNGDGTFGVDLNRNYSYMWGYDDVGSSGESSSLTYRGPSPFSEPETQAMRDFCVSRSFNVALSYHSYSELILFPWGYASLYTDDHDLFVALGDSLKRGNDYLPGNTAMGAIYPVNGDSDDWMYGDTSTKNRIFSFTIELNSLDEGGFSPPETLIQPTFDKVLELNLTLLRRAGNPHSVLGPMAPSMYAAEMLNPPNYKIHWSDGSPSDPNPPAAWELVEYKNLIGIVDSCEWDNGLWNLDGFAIVPTRSYVGTSSYYSGAGSNLHHTLTMATIYPLSIGDTLECWIWYDIEENWDYAYFEGSTDQGLTWKTITGNRTTNFDPNGANRGNGITGSSGGQWVQAAFYIESLGIIWENATVLLRFAYLTDVLVNNEGLYVDLVNPVTSYEARTVLASAHTQNYFHRWPEDTGEYAYNVRATDTENHKGSWSNMVFHTVDDLTAAPEPELKTVLSQNYPNPFNPVTTIKFAIGHDDCGANGEAHARLSIFDVSGREIIVLKNKMLPPGAYEIHWDGRGQDGNPLASGVYFARLSVGGKTYTDKMLLLR